ncbi:MAG: sensor histidine kinase, partial [Ignavibacteriaceae bacterium]|nr:sensor histidine kinase [Ignavibacteriaceae bacterium]
NHLLVLNQNWIRFLAEERRGAADEKPDVGLQQEIHAAHSMLKTTGLDDASDVSKVIEKVAAAFFAQQSVPIPDCVRIAQIASTLGATLGPSFQFVTRDNRRHGISAVIIFDPSGSLEDLLPETWRQQHFLHPDYTNSFTSCTSEEWLQWTTTGRSRISMFAPLTKKKTPLRGRANAMKEVGSTPIPNEIKLKDWFAERMNSFQVAADTKRIELIGKNQGAELFITDADFLGRIFDNLVSNAIKFSPEGKLVTVSIEESEQGYLISVEDNGLGIKELELKDLFEPFKVTSTKGTAGEKSTGLGLAIVKKAVEAHNGSISVKSIYGEGTIFTVFLPK